MAAGVQGVRWSLSISLLGGCTAPRSTLDPAGTGAALVAGLGWWMFAGALLIWILVMGLALYATRVAPGPHDERTGRLLIIGGGVLLPILVLGALLAYGLSLMPRLSAAPDPGAPAIEVSGERWWWRVRYELPQGGTVELANEIHLPLGERTEIRLVSADVIHAFWVPALAGKVDMVPGRENRLVLEPTRTGEFPGVCAEYCGSAHAHMGFVTRVSERADFERWLADQAEPALEPVTPVARRGRALFLSTGCGACHSIRGTAAEGVIGPDLTHVGSRRTLGAGVLPAGAENIARWVGHTRRLKPGVEMPAFDMLSPGDLAALAAYLAGLK